MEAAMLPFTTLPTNPEGVRLSSGLDHPRRFQAASADLYRSESITWFSLGNGLSYAYSPSQRRGWILPSHVGKVLGACQSFKTLDEHAHDNSRESTGGSKNLTGILAGLLNDLAKDRLLVSHSELRRQLSNLSEEPHVPVSSIAVITCDRPAMLHRCLASYVENTQRHGEDVDFLVMDDSKRPDTRRRVRDVLHALRKSCGRDVYYIGPGEKSRLTGALIARTGLPRAVVEFAVAPAESGYTVGASRNTLLLHSAGDIFLSFDDDTVCRTAAAPETGGGLAFSSLHDPADIRFFPDRETALHSVAFADTDLVWRHAELLGRPVGACVGAAGEDAPLIFEHVRSEFLAGLQSGHGRVLVTLSGLVGDCGMSEPCSFGATGKTRKRIFESEEEYQTSFLSREALRVVNRLTISEGCFCMAYAIGFDNRPTLPPFLPVLRNQDGVFGLLLRKCFDFGYFGHLPWAILHAPEGRRRFPPPDSWRKSLRFRVSELVGACITDCQLDTPGLASESKLQAIGKHLEELGSMPARDFEEFVRIQWAREVCSRIRSLQETLRSAESPPAYWENDVRSAASFLKSELTSRRSIVPQDLPPHLTGDGQACAGQELILEFGRLLQAWPALMQAARELRQNGHRAAVLA